jgi:outer membrane protein OmpA-like peptidoglycan-associated protein
VEFEFYDNGPEESGNYFYIRWVNEKGATVGEFGIVSGNDTWLQLLGKTLASKNLPERLQKGVHTMRIMATTRSMKCYIDEVRVANVPRVEGFTPAGFALYFRPYRKASNPTLCRGFRFAEGGKSMRDQLAADGRVVTHGILFDPDSYTIKATSYKTLKEIGSLLQEEPELRLSIEGHTDSDGADDHNLTLSQNRAGAVRDFLIQEFSIASDRLEAKGWGEQKPISGNDSPEGKANNRRVELVKL